MDWAAEFMAKLEPRDQLWFLTIAGIVLISLTGFLSVWSVSVISRLFELIGVLCRGWPQPAKAPPRGVEAAPISVPAAPPPERPRRPAPAPVNGSLGPLLDVLGQLD